MQLLVIRHAIADDRATFARSGKSDDERPLTAQGRRRMERSARGLRTVVPAIDVLATSPLVRAVETAEIVAAAYGGARIERVSALAPGAGPDVVAQWLAKQRARGTVAVVGHEPDLSMLVSYLLSGTPGGLVELKKGAACLLEFPGKAKPGEAMVRWLLAPRHLRALSRA